MQGFIEQANISTSSQLKVCNLIEKGVKWDEDAVQEQKVPHGSFAVSIMEHLSVWIVQMLLLADT